MPITLNVWLYPYWSGVTGTEDPAKSTPADVWKYMADEFKKTHPNVSFNFEVLDWSTGRQKVKVGYILGIIFTVLNIIGIIYNLSTR